MRLPAGTEIGEVQHTPMAPRGAMEMNQAYWDSIADTYDARVLSVFDHDSAGIIRTRIEEYAAPRGRAADLGCGPGKFVGVLAENFAEVEACDFSARSLAISRAHCRHLPNIRHWQLDLATEAVPFPPVDFVLCVNVLIVPCLDVRMRMWRAVTNQVAHGGTLLLVTPSVEWAYFERFRALDAWLDQGHSCATALRANDESVDAAVDLAQGIHRLDGQRTKHYSREELEQMLESRHFELTELIKLTYPEQPAQSERHQASGGWDWLALARRL